MKDEWKLGMPLLAEGHDEGVRAAALAEIAGAQEPEEQTKLGVLWYGAGQGIKEPADDNWHCFRRARYWLTKAIGSGTAPADAPWRNEAQRTLDLVPILRAPVVIKLHSFNSEIITIRRNEIEWISKGGSCPNEISSSRTGVALPAFYSKYPGEDRHTFGQEEVRKILPEGVDFSLARLRVTRKEGTTAAWTTAVIVPERSDDTKVTIRVAEWDSKNNTIGNYQGDFKFELILGWGEPVAGKSRK